MCTWYKHSEKFVRHKYIQVFEDMNGGTEIILIYTDTCISDCKHYVDE